MLLIQEKATLEVTTEGEGRLKIHNLDSIQLPEFEDISETHHAGGTIGEVDWAGLGLKALEPSFKLKGYDRQVFSQFFRRERQTFTVRGSLRDKQSQKLIGVRSVLHARLGKISPDAFEAGKILGHDYALKEVVHYVVYFDDVEKLYWDHFEVAFRLDGIDMLADERRILALPGA